MGLFITRAQTEYLNIEETYVKYGKCTLGFSERENLIEPPAWNFVFNTEVKLIKNERTAITGAEKELLYGDTVSNKISEIRNSISAPNRGIIIYFRKVDAGTLNGVDLMYSNSIGLIFDIEIYKGKTLSSLDLKEKREMYLYIQNELYMTDCDDLYNIAKNMHEEYKIIKAAEILTNNKIPSPIEYIERIYSKREIYQKFNK